MKRIFSFLLIAALATTAYADIQDPPMNDQGPTRKLGRGISNIFFSPTDIISTACKIQEREGNNAAASYGIVKGVGSFFFRVGAGWYDVITFPFPTYKGSYRPPFKLDVPWINGGHSEFPAELGWQSKFNYVRTGGGY